MDEDILLTIAVPTYNGEKTIGNMLDVLLPQCDSRVEVLVSDNASTDGTSGMIEQYAKAYPFIRHIRNERNIGPDSNFLQCMQMASGKYTLLLSDDDILLEGQLKHILYFMETEPDMSLIYLNAVGFRERYVDLGHCHRFKEAVYDDRSFSMSDKKEFMTYAGRMWGFLSCFVCLTEAFHSLTGVNRYKGTNWLQSYIHILCSRYVDGTLGVIASPCIGAGIYSIISNFDSGRVDGICYREMLDFAVREGGFDKKQLDSLYIWRVCFLVKRAVIKERAAGVKKTDVGKLVRYTRLYPSVWIRLYPFLLLPGFMCKLIVTINYKIKGYRDKVHINRIGDVVG